MEKKVYSLSCKDAELVLAALVVLNSQYRETARDNLSDPFGMNDYETAVRFSRKAFECEQLHGSICHFFNLH